MKYSNKNKSKKTMLKIHYMKSIFNQIKKIIFSYIFKIILLNNKNKKFKLKFTQMEEN